MPRTYIYTRPTTKNKIQNSRLVPFARRGHCAALQVLRSIRFPLSSGRHGCHTTMHPSVFDVDIRIERMEHFNIDWT